MATFKSNGQSIFSQGSIPLNNYGLRNPTGLHPGKGSSKIIY
jgi:hypothetical protein